MLQRVFTCYYSLIEVDISILSRVLWAKLPFLFREMERGRARKKIMFSIFCIKLSLFISGCCRFIIIILAACYTSSHCFRMLNALLLLFYFFVSILTTFFFLSFNLENYQFV